MRARSEYAAVIERFAETRSAGPAGRVCHALAGALRALLHHWHCRVAQLEHAALCAAPPLTLQVSPERLICSWRRRKQHSRPDTRSVATPPTLRAPHHCRTALSQQLGLTGLRPAMRLAAQRAAGSWLQGMAVCVQQLLPGLSLAAHLQGIAAYPQNIAAYPEAERNQRQPLAWTQGMAACVQQLQRRLPGLQAGS